MFPSYYSQHKPCPAFNVKMALGNQVQIEIYEEQWAGNVPAVCTLFQESLKQGISLFQHLPLNQGTVNKLSEYLKTLILAMIDKGFVWKGYDGLWNVMLPESPNLNCTIRLDGEAVYAIDNEPHLDPKWEYMGYSAHSAHTRQMLRDWIVNG